MSNDNERIEPEDSVLEEASTWTLRLDRGLTPEEQDDLSTWLAASPRHREAFALCRWGWDEFDRLAGLSEVRVRPPDPNLLAPAPLRGRPGIRRHLPFAASVAFAGIMAAAGYFAFRGDNVRTIVPDVTAIARIEQRVLEDGTRLEIDRGGQVEVVFGRDTRRVRLLGGQASFQVAKDAARPFVVEVGPVVVRAVGTAFNVTRGRTDVAVVVSEGVVAVASDAAAGSDAPGDTLLRPGDKGVVSLQVPGEKVQVYSLSHDELEDAELWRPRLLDFESEPLAAIVAEFNRRNVLQIRIRDSGIATRQLSLSFWSDNVDGFVRLLESSFGVNVEWHGAREVVLTSGGGRARD